jgi:putative ABC transport system permease protein
VRLAMGATRRRLIQTLLAESLVLALLGGALATGVVFGAPSVIAWWVGQPLPDPRLRPDATMALISLGLCFVTSLTFGLMPALRFSRPGLVSALKDESGSGGSRRVGRSHRITAAIQAGIAVPFLVICGLKLDNVRITATADLGFATAGLYAMPVDAEISPSPATIRRNLELAPGVTSVTFADGLPLDFNARESRIAKEGDANPRWVHMTRVDTGYLETMGIPLLQGRPITAEDRDGSVPVALLSRPLAARMFPAGDAVGHTLSLRLRDNTLQTLTVIGVTGDLVASQMASPRPQMFVPLAQHPAERLMAIARATASTESMQASFERVLPGMDAHLVQASLVTGASLIERSRWDLFSHSAVAGACAAIALVLTALGVFGVVGFMVATRTREIGVRIALGASRPRVLAMVLRDTVRLVVPGVVVGLALAVYLVRSDDFELAFYDLGVVEPLAYAAAAAVTIGVAVLSGFPSARRAAKVEPIVAMRTE